MNAFVRMCERPAAGWVVGGAISLSPRFESSMPKPEVRALREVGAEVCVAIAQVLFEDGQLLEAGPQFGSTLGLPFVHHASLCHLNLGNLGLSLADQPVGLLDIGSVRALDAQ
jgi:hypothetical protein